MSAPWNPAKDPKPRWLRGADSAEASAPSQTEVAPEAEQQGGPFEEQRDYARQDEAWALKQEGLTGSAVAARMKISRNAVIGLWHRYRQRHGIAPDFRPEDRPSARGMDPVVVELYAEGVPIAEIAAKTGYVNGPAIYNTLRRLGVKPNRQS